MDRNSPAERMLIYAAKRFTPFERSPVIRRMAQESAENTFVHNIYNTLDSQKIELAGFVKSQVGERSTALNNLYFRGNRAFALNSDTSLFSKSDIYGEKEKDKRVTRVTFSVNQELKNYFDELANLPGHVAGKDKLFQNLDGYVNAAYASLQPANQPDARIADFLQKVVPTKEAYIALLQDKGDEYKKITGNKFDSNSTLFLLRSIIDEIYIMNALHDIPKDAVGGGALRAYIFKKAGIPGLEKGGFYFGKISEVEELRRQLEPQKIDMRNELDSFVFLNRNVQRHISDKTLSNDIFAFFGQAQDPTKTEIDANLVGSMRIIVEGETRYVLDTIGDRGEKDGSFSKPTLVIRDLPAFVGEMEKVQRAINQERAKGDKGNLWAREQTLNSIWKNATAYDFSHPVEYLKGLVHEMEAPNIIRHRMLGPIEALKGTQSAEKRIYVFEESRIPVYESGHDIIVGISDAVSDSIVDTGDRSQHLHAIRYGRTDKDTATLYAIQMEKVYEDKDDMRQFFEKLVNRGENDVKSLLHMYRSKQTLYHAMLGIELSPELEHLAEQDPMTFIDRFLDLCYASEKASMSGIPGKEKKSDDMLDTFFKQKQKSLNFAQRFMISGKSRKELAGLVQDMIRVKRSVGYSREALDFYTRRSSTQQILNNPLRMRRKGNGEEGMESRRVLSQVPPAALVSLATALELFHQHGITHLRLPLGFPLRTHTNKEIDTRVLNQNKALMYRLMNEMQGISLDRSKIDDPDTGYLHFSLGELSSDNKLLQELLTKLRGTVPTE